MLTPTTRAEFTGSLVSNLGNLDESQTGDLDSGNTRAILSGLGALLENTDEIRTMMRRLRPEEGCQWLHDSAILYCRPEACDRGELFLSVIEESCPLGRFAQVEQVQLAEAYASLAEGYSLRRKLPERALTYLKKAAQLAPANCRVLVSASRIYAAAGRIDKALTAAREAIAACPGSADAWHVYGVQMRVAGNVGISEQSFRKALSLGHADVWTGVELASLLLDQGRCAESLTYIQEAIQRNPDIAYFRLLLGRAYVCMGDHSQALRAYQQLESMNQDYAEQLRLLIRQLPAGGGTP